MGIGHLGGTGLGVLGSDKGVGGIGSGDESGTDGERCIGGIGSSSGSVVDGAMMALEVVTDQIWQVTGPLWNWKPR